MIRDSSGLPLIFRHSGKAQSCPDEAWIAGELAGLYWKIRRGRAHLVVRPGV